MAYIRDPSQVMRTVQLNPIMVMKPKFLFRTGFLPRRAKVASSREVEPRLIGPKTPTCDPSFDTTLCMLWAAMMV